MLAGLPGHARLAGYALFNLPEDMSGKVPWQRVINAQGRVSYSDARHGNDHKQRELLELEGVVFSPKGRISLREFGWKPKYDIRSGLAAYIDAMRAQREGK